MDVRIRAGIAACVLVGLATSGWAQGTKADYRAGKRPAAPPQKAGGDSCALATPIISVDFIDSGNTSSATGTVDMVPIACNGNYMTVFGPDHIYTFTVTSGNSLTFQVSTSSDTYDISIYVLTTCGNGNTCVPGAAADNCFSRDLAQPAGCPLLDSTESFTTSLAPGTYFFYIDSYYAPGNLEDRDSGPYSLTVTGSLPVELMHFEID